MAPSYLSLAGGLPIGLYREAKQFKLWCFFPQRRTSVSDHNGTVELIGRLDPSGLLVHSTRSFAEMSSLVLDARWPAACFVVSSPLEINRNSSTSLSLITSYHFSVPV